METTSRAFKVLSFQPSEKSKREVALDKSMNALVDAMRELALVEKMTCRTGLSQRVCLAFVDVLVESMHLVNGK